MSISASVKSVPEQMRRVWLALVPGIIACCVIWGPLVLLTVATAVLTCVLTEALLVRLRQQSAAVALADGSAVVTGLILGLAISPLAPLWLVMVAAIAAIGLGKHGFGGLGQNPFNPAMVGYLLVLVSWPELMQRWPAAIDASTAATVLDQLQQQSRAMLTLQELQQQGLGGMFAARDSEWVNLAFLLGGLYLLQQRVIHWVIPLAVLLGLLVPASLLYLYDSDLFATPWLHLFSGASCMGAFFVATDPVSSPTSRRAQWLYGLGIGVIAIWIRQWGEHPDGIAFAVLLMNACVPLLDRLAVRNEHHV